MIKLTGSLCGRMFVLLVGVLVMFGDVSATTKTDSSASQPEALRELERYFVAIETLQGEFRQVTMDETGTVVEEAEGSFVIARPQRFVWDYRTPYEQVIVADGEQLWVHDVALDQVVVRPLDEALGVGAAQLLSGDFANLQAQFDLSVADDGRILMKPTDPAWDFQRVHLTLDDGVPTAIEVADGMGQRIVVELLDVVRNPAIESERFDFEPPEGVDVMRGS
ncbi:outer membrane lipoprotein chaperone LolA [Spiribacter vilamensis]|uniref:Outer-membrane lipoprotein carrier protein n=1 Tax=Spiribacter vilamensis TaxID=531306 RepID=A0A4Q8CYP6_9GAMM|nr:outer membrane lipoprotein chaperone LolA [Spiribacter vilamensis]RZU98113.1 outer membrane lipoprotein carrier protein [Spiribacter vilamensis]TVO60985.1 outer membrane lipoprotein chaperone LolA [Spiribacter vilamensis]